MPRSRLSSRPFLLALAAAGVLAVIAGVWVLRGRGGAKRQTIRVSLRHAALPDKNEQDIALPLESQLATVPRLTSQHIEITRLGVTADCSFEPGSAREREENLAAVVNAYTERLATVSEVPPEAAAIWIFSPKELTKELKAIGNVSVETCGEPQPERVRVAIDTDQLKTLLGGDIVELELAIGADTLHRLTRWEEVHPEEVADRTVHGDIRVKDVATVTREPRPNRCNGYLSDGRPSIAHAVTPLPGLTPDARARIDALARDAGATIVRDSDAVEARFTVDPNASFDARRRVAADYALRGKVVQGLDVVGSRVSFDGAGSLVLRRPASAERLKALIKETPDVAWGGIRGGHRLEVTIKGDDRKALEKRAKEVRERLSAVDGVGAPLTLTANTLLTFVYDVDTRAAEADGISVPALQLIASTMQGDGPAEAAVFIEPRPLDELYVRGAPLSSYVHVRQRPVTMRLFRADQRPAVELAFETEDAAAPARARQALGDSADVSLRVLPAF